MSDNNYLQPVGSLAFADIARFQYFHFNRRLWPLTLVAVLLLLLALLGIVAVLLPGSRGTITNPGFIVMFCWGLLILGSPYLAAKRQYHKQIYLREPMQYHFTDERVRLEGPNFSGEISWVLLQHVRETQSAFLLYQSPQVAWLLPKRFFSDDADIQAWKKFVISHLPESRLFSPSNVIGRRF